MDNQFEVVLKVGAEGGSITLYGIRSERGWLFSRTANESTLAEIAGISDESSVHKSKIVDTWEDALGLLHRYPWHRLVPLTVHPEFGAKIWREVLNRDEEAEDPFDMVRWMQVCFGGESAMGQLSWLMKRSRSTVILTGAGMSTESDVPDFRSKDGWWRNIDPITVATVEALEDNYNLFHDFYKTRIEALQTRAPHSGHYILAKWENRGLVDCVATQNVDGFHEAAGSKDVYELHGSIRTIRCHQCGSSASVEEFVSGSTCSQCGGKLRPNVVLFGEMLPQDAWNQALTAIRKADLVLVIGSSLQVSPVNSLPSLTQGKIAIINAEETQQDEMFDVVVHGRAGEVLDQLDEIVG